MGEEPRIVRALVHIITHTVQYTFLKCYMGLCFPRRTVMDLKKKKKKEKKHPGLDKAGGQSESLPGERSQRATGQTSPTSAHAQEGKSPIGEAHGRPPDLPSPQMLGSTVWEPKSIDQKASVPVYQALRPVSNGCSRTCSDPWRHHHQSVCLFRVSITAQGGTKHSHTMHGERAACCPPSPSILIIFTLTFSLS
jgi:hypothetical protein